MSKIIAQNKNTYTLKATLINIQIIDTLLFLLYSLDNIR